VVAGAAILLARHTRTAATYLGTWIVLLVIFIYGPMLIASLLDPSNAVKIEGINYFADTLLFAAAILALASATPASQS
jgi:type IV secretory pathway TrbL component